MVTSIHWRDWTVWSTQRDPLHHGIHSERCRIHEGAQTRIIASVLTGTGRGYGLYTASPGRIARPLIAQKPDARAPCAISDQRASRVLGRAMQSWLSTQSAGRLM
jgi:hypothetical protein